METKQAPQSKQCFKCHAIMAIDQFYKHKMMADGYLNKCKQCTRADVVKNRKEKVEYYRSYDRARGSRQTAEYLRAHREAYPKKAKARNAVGNAVRDGKLQKPGTCQECGAGGRIHGHHDDYDKPLDVRWLCAACHKQWHVANGEGANGS